MAWSETEVATLLSAGEWIEIEYDDEKSQA
jgi:hypothetical protein